jgi:2-C-methyl-D-erythritol 4-phosphate cytidylyltransferase
VYHAGRGVVQHFNHSQSSGLTRRVVGAVVLAAGSGERLGRGPKALVTLSGRPLLSWALDALFHNEVLGEVVVVAHEEALPATQELVSARGDADRVRVVPGGPTRQASARRGVDCLSPEPDYVATVDAVRPFTPVGALDAMLTSLLSRTGDLQPAGVVPGLPVFDTVRLVDGMGISQGTPSREAFRSVQSPQLFCRTCLIRAYELAEAAGTAATDDATLLEQMGEQVLVIAGDHENFKVTVDSDLRRAEALVAYGRRS